MLDWKSINQKAGANSAPPARQQASASQPYIPAKVSAPGTKKAKEEQRKALVQNSWLDNYNLSLPGGVGKMYAKAKPEVAQQAVNETNDMMAQAGKSGISRFGLRMLDSINPAGSALNSIERTTGQKLDRSTITTPIAEDWNKSPANVLRTVKEQATDPGNLGMLVGTGVQYGITGGLALERAVAGGLSKIPALANVSAKAGKVSSEIGKGVVSNAVGGAPINALMSADEISVQDNPTGSDFAKSMAINTALDVVLGGAIEGVSAFKRVKKLSKEKQAEVLKKVSEQTGMSEQEIKPLLLDAPAINWDYGSGKMPDFNATRKSNLGKLKFSKSGREVDKVYNSLSERYPDLFPDSIANPADQTEKIIEVANSLKSKTITIGDAFNDDDLWTGSLGKVWGAIEKYRSTVKENVSYDNARGLKEAPRTAVKSELSEGVKARKLPQRTENKLPKKMAQKETSIYSIAKGQKEVPKTVIKSELSGSKPQKKDLKETLTAQIKKENEVKKELPKKEVKTDDTSRKLNDRPEKKSDPRTEAVIEKLHRVARENPSIQSEGKLYEVSDHPYRNRVESIAKKFNIDTVFVKPLTEDADYFNGLNMDGVIVISDKSDNPINVVLGHELLHQLKKDNNAAYEKFSEIFKKELKGDKFAKYNKVMQDAGKDVGKDFGYNEVIEEMIADFSGEMFNNPKVMQRIFEEDATLAKKIYDIITEMISKLKGNIKEAYLVSDGVKNLKAVQDEYVKLMKTAKNSGASGETKFSLKKPIEETKDLIAIHNISDTKLFKALELGGFPVPSIAIINAKDGHLNFGEISIVFSKQTISPTNRQNKIYASDIYSVRFPEVSYEINDRALSKLNDTIRQNDRGFYADADTFSNKTPESAIEWLSSKKPVKEAFLQSINKTVKMPTKNAEFRNQFNELPEVIEYIKSNKMTVKDLVENESLRNGYLKAMKEGLAKKYDGDMEVVDYVYKNYEKSIDDKIHFGIKNGFYEGDGYVKPLQHDFDIANGITKKVDDTQKYGELVDKQINRNKSDYEKYLADLVNPLFGSKGIRNERDLFTPTGNRRSWKQLNDPYTLDNVTKAMTGKGVDSEGFSYGIGNIRASLTKEFKSIDEVKANKSRLVSSEEFQKFKQETEEEFMSLADTFGKYHKSSNDFSYLDIFANSLNQAAKKGINKPTLVRELKADMFDTLRISSDELDSVINFFNKLKEAPTEYFEAKPQRAVGFDEISAVVLPKNTSKILINRLKEKGVKILKYDKEIDGDRTAKLNSIDDVRFSLKHGMSSGLHRERVKRELAENGEYQEIIKELEDVIINDDPIIEHIAKSIKDHKGITLGIKDIYRNMRDAFGVNYPIIKEKYLNPFDKSKKDYVNTIKKYTDTVYNDITTGLKIKKGSKESAAVQWIGEGKRQMGWEWQFDEISGKKYKTIKLVDYTLDDLQADFPNKWKDIKSAADKMRTLYDSLIDEVNESRRKIYPTNQSKLVPKRKDYFRHYREMASSFEGLWNAFSSPANIDPRLAGISDYTQPKSRWASYMQQRGMGKYKEDAIGGFLDYIGPASYSINIDPHINKFRGLAKQIAEATVDTKNANGTITYLHDFANSLAGKTVDLDRLFIKTFDRKVLVVLNTLNNRVKKNQILLNARSALSQVANIPLGIAKIKNPMALIPGAGDAISSIAGINPKVNELYKESQFISERYSHDLIERFNTRMIDKPEQFAGWMLEAMDQLGTKFIWNSAYRSAFDKGIEDAIQYADDVTRALVAGRGIGEVPLLQQSKVFQLIAPFQLEVTNLWHVFGDMRREKDFAGIALILLGNYLFNNAYEEAVGDRVVFDPIDAVSKSIREGNTADETAGRLTGEFLSNIPLGQSFAALYPEYGNVESLGIYGLPTRKQFFGDEDPTRYGSGALLVKAINDPLYKLVPPFGGNQAKKTIEAVKALNKGEVSKDGKIKYLVEKNPENMVKGALFGKYAFDEAKEYDKKGRRPLTEKQSETIRNSDEPKVAYEKKMVLRKMENIDRKISDVKKNEELSEKEKNKEIVKLLREKVKEIKNTDLYTEEEKSQKILKLQGQILRYQE